MKSYIVIHSFGQETKNPNDKAPYWLSIDWFLDCLLQILHVKAKLQGMFFLIHTM